MSYAIDGFNITLTRGDAFSVRLPLSLDGNEYALQPGDVVRFAINTADHEDTPEPEIPESEVPTNDAEGMG